MPRSPDPAIFVLTTDTTDHFTPCACARGNNDDDDDDTADYFTPSRLAHARGVTTHSYYGLQVTSVIAQGYSKTHLGRKTSQEPA